MPETVKVRIAVAVDKNGAWHSAGWDDLGDDEAFSYAVECLEPGEARYILTAELPLPTVSEVPAQVEVQE